MRISDWSSDVCSSDLSFSRLFLLSVLSLQRAVGLRLVVAQAVERRALVQEARLRRHRDQHPLVHQQHRLAQLLVPGPERKADPLEATEREVFAAQIVAQLGEVGAAGARSEEQTSELQSLMRISSAVFCLKKKQ